MRKLTPELLDHLPHDDPGAIRSRRDLRRINRFMGNNAWILSQISSETKFITEIGSGDGYLLNLISKQFPHAELTAYDLAPRRENLPAKVRWIQGDILHLPPARSGGLLIANLFLHHFTDKQLGKLAQWLHHFDTLIFNEPLRSKLPLLLGKAAYPFIHPITRHDMRVSIEAGFVIDEIPSILHLDSHGFTSQEIATWRGSLRLSSKKGTQS